MRIFLSFTRQAFQCISVYRFNFFMEFILTILQMYAIYWVWRILYTQGPGAFGISHFDVIQVQVDKALHETPTPSC